MLTSSNTWTYSLPFSRPHLYDLWRELRSKRPELIDEFEIVVRELACEFDDKVNGLHEQIATLTHAMQR